jgi:Single Cache domain 2
MQYHDRDASSMNILSRLRLRTKLALLLVLSALALVVSIGAAASLLRHRMVDDRVDKLRAVVQSTIAIAQSLEDRALAHVLTREQALALLRDDIHAMRFDAGSGYLFAQSLDNIFVLHGANPALEGKPSSVVNENGTPLTELIRDALRNSDSGTTSASARRSQRPTTGAVTVRRWRQRCNVRRAGRDRDGGRQATRQCLTPRDTLRHDPG